MKKTNIVFIALFSILPIVYGANYKSNTFFQSINMSYDSIIIHLHKPDISLDDKYLFVREIEETSPANDIINIYNIVLAQSKKQDHVKYISSLYCAIANCYMLTKDDLEKAKTYLDSAFMLEKKNKDTASLALMNFMMSRYYSIKKDEAQSHKYLYKTIDYFEKMEGKKSTAILLLYNLSEAYYKHNDTISLKKTKDRMDMLSREVKEDFSYLYTYNVANSYYSLLYKGSQKKVYLDSITQLNNKVMKIYDANDDAKKLLMIGLVCQDILNTAESMTYAPKPNWIQINRLLDKIDTMGAVPYLGLNENRLNYFRIRAKALFENGELDEALINANMALDIMNNEMGAKDPHIMLSVYAVLLDIYEHKGNYKKALEFSKLRNEVRVEINELNKYKIIKDLESKYETTKKELQISQLNEEKQETHFRAIIMIACFIIIAILLIIALLYNRNRRLKKEKETAVMARQIEEKETQYQSLLKDTELKQIHQYLKGLESERTRLAKELHDNVSNELVAIKMQIENKADSIQIIDSLRGLHDKVRNISHDLIPPVFQYATLPEILTDHIYSLNSLSKTSFTLSINDEDIVSQIPQKTALEIYRVVQEASGNILKYADAENASISLDIDGSNIILNIKDNGNGFDPNSKKTSVGLNIIKNRALSLNGTFTIESEIGKGCKISLTIPHQQCAVE